MTDNDNNVYDDLISIANILSSNSQEENKLRIKIWTCIQMFFIETFWSWQHAINETKAATETKTLCENPIYFFNQYVIIRRFYLMLDRIWFETSDLYTIKQSMHLSRRQITDFDDVTHLLTGLTTKFYLDIG